MNDFNAPRRQFLEAVARAGLLGFAPVSTILAADMDFDPARLKKLAKGFDGVIVGADNSAYEQLRKTASFNPRFDRRPLAIAQCRTESDIAKAIAFARRYELPVAVRSGGHDVLAASTCDAGLLIDLGALNNVQVVNKERRIRLGAGLRAGSANLAAAEHALAIPLGCNSAVGVSGLTLGGGIGWFVGTRGAACDNVTSARVVTVDGEIVDASPAKNESLFWGLRGGGGNLGVVSEWTFKAFPMHEVYCGALVYPGSKLREFIAMYREYMTNAPDEVTVEVIGLAHQSPVIVAVVCYCGDKRKADEVIRPLRKFGPPVADSVSWRPYAELESLPESVSRYFQFQDQPIAGEVREPGSYWQGSTVRELSDPVIDSISEALASAPRGWSFGFGHVMRGEFMRMPQAATPLVRQAGAVTVHFDGGWSYRSRAAPMMNWIDAANAMVAKHAGGASDYINYMSTNESTQIERAYGESYARLVQLKREYDPDNILDGNRNIRPKSGRSESPW